MDQLLGHSITYRIAVGPQAGRKVFTLQTLPACDEPFDDLVHRDGCDQSRHRGANTGGSIFRTGHNQPYPARWSYNAASSAPKGSPGLVISSA